MVAFCTFLHLPLTIFFAKRYHLLPKVTICCRKLPFIARRYHLLPKVTICCKNLLFVAKIYHLLPTGTIRLPGQYVALPNRDNMSPGTICRPFEQQNNGDIGRHIVPATYCPGTIYVLGQNVAGQNVSWPSWSQQQDSHCKTAPLLVSHISKHSQKLQIPNAAGDGSSSFNLFLICNSY